MTENSNKTANIIEDDEITLKQIILRFAEFLRYFVSNWKLLLILSFLFALYSGYKSYKTDNEYNAKLTFMISRNEAGSIGSIGAILGRFGFGSKTDNNKDKIVQLNKSRKIIENAIFQKVKINDSEDYIANHIINNLDTLGKWAKTPWYLKPFNRRNILKDFRFDSGNVSEFGDTSNLALKTVYGIVVGDDQGGKGMMSNGYDEDSGILYVSTSTYNPELSVELTNSIFDNLSEFYIEKTIEKQKATYEIVKTKTDSILYLLKKKEAELAAFEDRAHGIFSSKTKLTELRLKRDVQKLSLMYGESIKNLEIADFAVRNKTPYIQAIDRPILPLKAKKPSTIKSFVLGGILGMFLGVIFLFLKKIYRDAMSQ